jgi:UDP-2,4-diacetamido-2,4,6-trideoxy-beta-L-altropyranose hydrolase
MLAETMIAQEVVFRTDASLQIGTGHVMRCLTLADALKAAGARCRFICRELPGHLLDLIRQRGHEAIALSSAACQSTAENSNDGTKQLAHAEWLGVDWRTDAVQTEAALYGQPVEWLIVDHYALDAHWEAALKSQYRKLMVIDDLADREHICDVLLDQNLIETMETRYRDKVPAHCTCLIGPPYALVRPEFNYLRPTSLARRQEPILDRLLIFMGGSDPEIETCKVIAGIQLSKKCWRHIDVVVGQGFPALHNLKASLATLPSTALHIQTPDMAKLMSAADLAVTAGGSVTWEKCALGLPSLVVILGENQRPIASMLHARGAQRTLGMNTDLSPACYAKYLDEVQTSDLAQMINCASTVCDGLGTQSALKALTNHS